MPAASIQVRRSRTLFGPGNSRDATRNIGTLGRFFGGLTLLFKVAIDVQEVVVVFDPTWPIDQQLKRAKYVLETCQSERGKKLGSLRLHKSLFANYLRILDAKDAGATEAEIAGVLFPRLGDSGVKRVKNHYRAAKYLRDGGYLLIAGEHGKLRPKGPE